MAGLDPGPIAVVSVAVFFLVWYYAAFVYSRRVAARVAREFKDAVLALGGTSKIRWFGTTAFRMTTEAATPPFKEAVVTVTLRPREMPINWAIATAQGRRDAALVEASLRSDPEFGFELIDPETRVGRRRSNAKASWSPLSLGARERLLSSDDERGARRILEGLDPETVDGIAALHVTAGTSPGIAASVSVAPGAASRGIGAILELAKRLEA